MFCVHFHKPIIFQLHEHYSFELLTYSNSFYASKEHYFYHPSFSQPWPQAFGMGSNQLVK